MSARKCDRKNCDNVLCNRYSDDYGYICETCFNELLTKPYIKIRDFMKTPVKRSYHDTHAWEKVCNKIFIDNKKVNEK